jgi:ATP-dependent Clp protease protease subunit
MPKDDDEDEGNQTDRARGLIDSIQERLFKQRTIMISSDINQKLAAAVSMQLLAMSGESDKLITMVINSQGGHVESGDTIHDMIRFVRAPVRMIGTGGVASAGALIYDAVPRERRFCLPNTRFLLHQPSGGVAGASSDVEIQARQIVLMRERLNLIMARGTGQSVERIENDTKRDFWLNAKDAITYGLAGRIIETQQELEAL